jgi:hypothetical protein
LKRAKMILHCVTNKVNCKYRTESEESGCAKYDCDNLYRCEYVTIIIIDEKIEDNEERLTPGAEYWRYRTDGC